jgi:hypothetical protein
MALTINLLFVLIFISNYVIASTGLPKAFSGFIELFSLIILVYSILLIAVGKKLSLDFKYLYIFVFYILLLIFGFLLNEIPAIGIFRGLRDYLKFIPMFVLPLVKDVSDKEIRSNLILIFTISIVQVPLSIFQRFIQYNSSNTGDYIAGTLTAAPTLSIFMVCVIAMLMGFYLKKKINTYIFIFLILLLSIPTTINETKGTLFLLPISLMIPVLFSGTMTGKIKTISIVSLFLFIFIFVFNFTYTYYWGVQGKGIDYFFKKQLESSVYKGTSELEDAEIEEANQVPRIDAMILAFKSVSDDLATLFFGVGASNASGSKKLGVLGSWNEKYSLYNGRINTISHVTWELGVFGLIILLTFMLFVLRDALALKNGNTLISVICLGWVGVLGTIFITLPYQNILSHNIYSYLIMYFSGIIASKRYSNNMHST